MKERGNKGWIGLGVLCLWAAAWAQEPSGVGFSRAELKQIVPHRSSVAECVRFEAVFSRPLVSPPRATMDIEKADRIQGVISKLLEVIQVAPNRYQLTMQGERSTCRTMLENGGNVSVTIDGGRGADGLPVLPDQRTFKTGRDFRIP